MPVVALEQLKERGVHNDLLTGYLYDFSVDKALSIEEMPINLPFNGQGQGYINTNFLIKELIVVHAARPLLRAVRLPRGF